jgi:hypothetical protein
MGRLAFATSAVPLISAAMPVPLPPPETCRVMPALAAMKPSAQRWARMTMVSEPLIVRDFGAGLEARDPRPESVETDRHRDRVTRHVGAGRLRIAAHVEHRVQREEERVEGRRAGADAHVLRGLDEVVLRPAPRDDRREGLSVLGDPSGRDPLRERDAQAEDRAREADLRAVGDAHDERIVRDVRVLIDDLRLRQVADEEAVLADPEPVVARAGPARHTVLTRPVGTRRGVGRRIGPVPRKAEHGGADVDRDALVVRFAVPVADAHDDDALAGSLRVLAVEVERVVHDAGTTFVLEIDERIELTAEDVVDAAFAVDLRARGTEQALGQGIEDVRAPIVEVVPERLPERRPLVEGHVAKREHDLGYVFAGRHDGRRARRFRRPVGTTLGVAAEEALVVGVASARKAGGAEEKEDQRTHGLA